MKRWISLFVMVMTVFCVRSYAQDKISGREFTVEKEDTTIIMKKYFLCIYITGPNRSQSSQEALELQVAHLAHNDQLSAAGKVVMAGPLESGPNGRMKGILVFDTDTQEDAEMLVCQDPMVRVSRLEFEVIPWWTAKGACLP